MTPLETRQFVENEFLLSGRYLLDTTSGSDTGIFSNVIDGRSRLEFRHVHDSWEYFGDTIDECYAQAAVGFLKGRASFAARDHLEKVIREFEEHRGILLDHVQFDENGEPYLVDPCFPSVIVTTFTLDLDKVEVARQ